MTNDALPGKTSSEKLSLPLSNRSAKMAAESSSIATICAQAEAAFTADPAFAAAVLRRVAVLVNAQSRSTRFRNRAIRARSAALIMGA